MSRVGKLPIVVSAGIKVMLNGNNLQITGAQGTLNNTLPNEVNVEFIDNKIIVTPKTKNDRARAMWGLSRSLIANMVHGVSKGYTKVLEISGVGFRASAENNTLTLFLGFSHDIKYIIPQGISIKCPKPTSIEVTGYDKQLVGQVAAEIKVLRKPEPYKGKGIKYESEHIRRKAGKKK